MKDNVIVSIDLGTWIGRGRALAVVASKSSVARPECLRTVRESVSHQSPGRDQFCDQRCRARRRPADREGPPESFDLAPICCRFRISVPQCEAFARLAPVLMEAA
jgi:hypothetical protein